MHKIFFKEQDVFNKDNLKYSLLGVVDVVKALDVISEDEIFNFFRRKHPALKGSKFRPIVIKKIDQDRVFAIFIVTKENNPDLPRYLVSNSDVEAFREENKILFIDDKWNTFDDILLDYNKK